MNLDMDSDSNVYVIENNSTVQVYPIKNLPNSKFRDGNLPVLVRLHYHRESTKERQAQISDLIRKMTGLCLNIKKSKFEVSFFLPRTQRSFSLATVLIFG